jgi:hypothetical protein
LTNTAVLEILEGLGTGPGTEMKSAALRVNAAKERRKSRYFFSSLIVYFLFKN